MTAPKRRVLIVDDEESIRRMLRLCLDGAGYAVTLATSGEAAIAAARKAPPDVVLADMRLPAMSGVDVTKALAQEAPAAKVIVMTAYATVDNAVDAMRAGAVDYLPKPFTPAQVLHVLGKAFEAADRESELAEARRTAGTRGEPKFSTRSPAYKTQIDIATRVAATDATLLILGDTGSGKGVLARHVHALSPRAGRPFVTVNCAVISPTLIESELFGHARGAYTGADSARAGHVEAAGSGTLFLDEVGDLPMEVQGKLLRLLEEREYVRVGETEPRKSEARIIAATHRDLRSMAHSGTFREDLYYRLDVVTVRLPSLAERGEDVPELAERVLRALATQYRRGPLTIGKDTMAALVSYPWPGNVRELVNVLERAVILGSGDVITKDLLPADVERSAAFAGGGDGDESLDAAERRHIAGVLARHPTLDGAARALHIDPSTLYRKRERYGLR